jgi:hypothetical protein
MAPAKRRCTAPARLRKPHLRVGPQLVAVCALLADEDDDWTIMPTPPTRVSDSAAS